MQAVDGKLLIVAAAWCWWYQKLGLTSCKSGTFAQKKFDQRYIQILSLALGSMFKTFRPINLQIMTAAEGRWYGIPKSPEDTRPLKLSTYINLQHVN